VKLLARQQQLDALLPVFHELWHPQPFREIRPVWCERWPALTAALLALSDDEASELNRNEAGAIALLAKYLPTVAELAPLAALPARPQACHEQQSAHWAWEIPGRKRQQIEAFAAAARSCDQPVIDWCGGKGHLGRLLAQQWQLPVQTLEIDPVLCAEGESLAARQRLTQDFIVAYALTVTDWPKPGQHAVALHACGELHRRLIQQGAEMGVQRFDVAPCCYYRGVEARYQPLTAGLQTQLTRDDTRLAVTETITASPRLVRQRDKEMAWKLGFDAWRRATKLRQYKTFKPVPAAWFRGQFADFLLLMAEREGLPQISAGAASYFEAEGWQRQRDVLRLSVVRHAFRRSLEVWLALDLAVYLETRGYVAELGSFCPRDLTPRNLLISAQRG
jgi:hypothetical protein